MALRINVGCGITPTPGWINLDNSPSVRLASWRPLADVLVRTPLLPAQQRTFVSEAMAQQIRFASATRLPFEDGSVEVVYSSHMLEHLPQPGARQFLREAYRVLMPGVVIRLALPDLRRLARAYLDHGDADAFVAGTYLAPTPSTGRGLALLDALRSERHHQWMYDGCSLTKALTANGFQDARVLGPGETTIAAPGDLDLAERADESVYAEARR